MNSEIKPIIVNDLKDSILFRYNNKEPLICIGSCEKDKYIFAEENRAVKYLVALRMMNGEKTLYEIKSTMANEYGDDCVDELYQACLKCGFILNDNSFVKQEFNELNVAYINVLAINISKVGSFFSKLPRKLYYAIFSCMLALICLAVYHVPNVLSEIPFNYVLGDARAILYAICISSIAVLFHEIGHFISAAQYGIPITTAQLSTFTFVSFACYVRLPGIYFLPPRQRCIIWISGVFVNLFFAACAILLFQNILGEQFHLFLSMLIICNISIAIYALIPFYISDGYFIVATLLKTPNLRKDVFANIIGFFKSHSKHKMEFKSKVYLLYFILTVGFTIIITLFFAIPLLIVIIGNILSGDSFSEVFLANINIFIGLGILVISQSIRGIVKKVKKQEKAL
jgi:putative peptide zinc metalloprotease protein